MRSGITFEALKEQLGGESLHLIETTPLSNMRQQLEEIMDLGITNERWIIGSRLLLHMEDVQRHIVQGRVADVILTSKGEKLKYDKEVLSEQELTIMQFKMRCMYRNKAYKQEVAKEMGITYKQTKSFLGKGRGLHGNVNRLRTFHAMQMEVNGSVPRNLSTMHYHDGNFSEAEKLCPGWLDYVTTRYRSVHGSKLDIPTTSSMARAKILQCLAAQAAGLPPPRPEDEPIGGSSDSPKKHVRSESVDVEEHELKLPPAKKLKTNHKRHLHPIMYLDTNICALLDAQQPMTTDAPAAATEEIKVTKPSILTNAAMINILRKHSIHASSKSSEAVLFGQIANLWSKCYHHKCDAAAFECEEVEQAFAEF